LSALVVPPTEPERKPAPGPPAGRHRRPAAATPAEAQAPVRAPAPPQVSPVEAPLVDAPPVEAPPSLPAEAPPVDAPPVDAPPAPSAEVLASEPIVQPARVERRWREWPITLVLACVLISLIVVAANHFRRGSVLLAASVLLATGLRLVLPARQAGLLAVRSRLVDVIALGGLGGGLMVLALVVPPPS